MKNNKRIYEPRWQEQQKSRVAFFPLWYLKRNFFPGRTNLNQQKYAEDLKLKFDKGFVSMHKSKAYQFRQLN